ncbi:MAG TPA: hypothetical protein VKR06_46255 [Ktedonosporobacter sp.]|nr:hypothetical protein [Ktedonosporobacter sp.]
MSEGILATAEIASIRADAAAVTCSQPCTIQRKATTRDAFGTETEIWATVATCLVGLAEPTAGQLTNYAFLIGSLAAWKVQLPYGTNVQRQDHLLIAGKTLVAQVDLSPQSYNMLSTMLCTEIL